MVTLINNQSKGFFMKYKVVCFDLDGTVIDETIFIWQTIHDAITLDHKKRWKYEKQYYNKEISYEEWAVLDVELWKEAGATKDDILKSLKDIRLMKGAKETIIELKKRGYKLAIISGSLNFAIEKVLPEYEELFDHIYLSKVFFGEDRKINRMIPTKYDFEHKATAMREIAEKEGISPKECIFIGDHRNDVYAAELAGFSIAFNSKSEELNKVADVVIKKKDMREILKVI